VKRVQWQHLVAAALITSFVCGAVAACGRTAPTVKSASASPDPIVGTWRALSGAEAPRWVIIAKVDGSYLAIVKQVFYVKVGGRFVPAVPASPSRPARVPLERAGDTLTGMFWSDGDIFDAVKISFLPASGHLTWTEWGRSPSSPFSSDAREWTSKPIEMTRVSNSTALPSPSP
jgi:hypothetical protein